MLTFAYTYNNNLLKHKNDLKLNNVVMSKYTVNMLSNINTLYYEDNIVASINDTDLISKYYIKKSLVVELDYNDYKKIEIVKKRLNVLPSEIEYSIVSRGTEKSGSKGYMAISKKIDKHRYLLVLDHNKKFIESYKDSLDCYSYEIENIALSRFELISKLALEKYKFSDNILVLGIGNIGISTLIYLLDNKYKNITIYLKNKTSYIMNGIKLLNQIYKVNIKIVDDLKLEYDTYIDTTGSSEVLEQVFQNIKYNKCVFLIGTPRDSEYLIDPLLINRNNIIIIGGHELHGIPYENRLNSYKSLLKQNSKKKYLSQLISITPYKKNIIEKKLEKKSNFIEVIKYDS